MSFLGRIFIALVGFFVVSGMGVKAQNDTLCDFSGEQHFRCASDELMEAIRAYEDTLSTLTETTIHDIYILRRQEGNRVWFEFDCDSLGVAIEELVAQIEAARVPPVPPGSFDPCSNFMNVVYYGASIRCLGSATGERDFLDNCWFGVNLRNTHFANGDSIPEAASELDWQNANGPVQALYRDSSAVLNEYGLHYNPAAILDSRKLCPPGWTLPDSIQVENLETWASESDRLNSAQRRTQDGEWAPLSLVDVGDEIFEEQATTQFYALDFSNASVLDSLVYYANNSAFNASNPVASRYLGFAENHGLSVRCRRMNAMEIELDEDYQAWAETPQAVAMEYPSYYYVQMPHVHTLEADGTNLRGEVYYTGPGAVTATGFKWGVNEALNPADSVVAQTNDFPAAEWSESSHQQVLDSLFLLEINDLNDGETYYYSAWAKNNFGYSFGDTLQLTYVLPPFDCGVETVTYDGHEYGTALIGDQCWFAENLQTTVYADGASIPLVSDGTDWQGLSSGARCAMNNDQSTVAAKGYLYNQHAVMEEHGLCPSGWHVPSDDDWKELESYLGVPEAELNDLDWRGTNEAEELKSTAPGWDGNNSTGFSALPLGSRGFVGDFYNSGSYFTAWTSTFQTYRALTWETGGIQRALNDPRLGASIRCLLGTGAVAPTVSTEAASAVDLTLATLNGTVVEPGDSAVTATGFVWGINADLSDGANLASSTLTGSFTGELTGLSHSTVYYYAAYATTAVETAFGDTLSFTTNSPPPVVETVAATGITESDAGISGSVLLEAVTGEVTESGFIFGTSSTLADGQEIAGEYAAGSVSASLSSLDEGTNYYYVAFVSDDNGRSFGDTLVFRTGLHCSAETIAACGTETLTYQGYEYNLYGIGNQCWFRDNLRANYYSDGTEIQRNLWMSFFDGSAENGVVSRYGEGHPTFGDGVYFNSHGGVDRHGLIYNGYAAQREEGLCPAGWHVPTVADFEALEENLPRTHDFPDYNAMFGSSSEVTCFRGTQSGYYWGTRASNTQNFYVGLNTHSSFLTQDLTPPPYRAIFKSYTPLPSSYTDFLDWGGSVRCVKGDLTPREVFACGTSTVNFDGHEYTTFINFDGRCWFQENLQSSLYANGDSIAGELTESEWLNTSLGAQAVYDNDTTNLTAYGRLYNHYAIRDERGICPSGWHVSTTDEWDDVLTVLGGVTGAASALKSNSDWVEGGSQISFEGVPAGFRVPSVGLGYQGIGFGSGWWVDQETPKAYTATTGNHSLGETDPSNPLYADLERFGYSVRCVKEPSLPVVETLPATWIESRSAQLNAYVNYMTGDETVTEVGLIKGTAPDLSIESQDEFIIPLSGGADEVFNAGAIEAAWTNLIAGTTYYYTFYATNEFGTTYGDTLSFTTDFNCGTDGILYSGHFYGTTLIGDDCWMSEDLRVTIYRDGTPIPSELNTSEWVATMDGAQSFYQEDNPSSFQYSPGTSRLYNWATIATGELCPPGYRNSTDADWAALAAEYSTNVGDLLAAGLMESLPTSSFSANPLGLRDGTTGEFSDFYEAGYYWTSSQDAGSNPWYWKFTYDGPGWWEGPTLEHFADRPVQTGMHVRCLKE